MLDINKLKDEYKIHPLILCRSIEITINNSELFDVLEDMPQLPIKWHNGRWETCNIFGE